METVLKAIADWIKGILTAGIMSNLSGLFDDVNTQVGNIAQQVGTKPSSFEPRVFAMIEALSRNVVLPIAGIILTFIACYELIEMITQHNNIVRHFTKGTSVTRSPVMTKTGWLKCQWCGASPPPDDSPLLGKSRTNMGDLNLLTQLSTCFVLFCDWRIGTHQFSLHTLCF